MKKILFVCLGNICRSPAAEAALIHELQKLNLSSSVIVDSAGTSGYHDGQLPDERMISEALKRGITLPTRSRKIREEDLIEFDLILAMDKQNLSNILKLKNAKDNQSKIKLFSHYKQNFNYEEVPDPYFGTLKDFNLVLDIVTDFSRGLILHEFKNNEAK